MNDEVMTQSTETTAAPESTVDNGDCCGRPADAPSSTQHQPMPRPQGGGCGPSCGCAAPQTTEADTFEAKVRKAINKVRPFLQMDGGDMEIIAIEDNNVLVKLQGACQSCAISTQHMKYGIEVALKKELPGFGDLIVIE